MSVALMHIVCCLQEYEMNSYKYRSALGKPEINSKSLEFLTLAEAVESKVL